MVHIGTNTKDHRSFSQATVKKNLKKLKNEISMAYSRNLIWYGYMAAMDVGIYAEIQRRLQEADTKSWRIRN